jgi:uncharacterized protein (DUF305 family)
MFRVGIPPIRNRPGKDFNAADVGFADDMIVHHREAIAIADRALSAGTPRVRPLTERIRAAQDPEISTMSGWLANGAKTCPLRKPEVTRRCQEWRRRSKLERSLAKWLSGSS